ncbi:hypothetical protein [Pontibacter arcticus]|uniref:SpoIIAA-like n=1 Tax=Pontibacter arcticus TaxID=2080288 RepID=A0A364RIH2_9BACT|nr:hypothetical protein [Pontibacter arcticus]RAU84099.1 hypothetical protein DP923_03355 [Pontibacter arcticus]
MSVIKYDLMELVYEETGNVLNVSWSDELSVESSRFLQTVAFLFRTIQEKEVANLIIDSGMPAGGILTEEVIHCFIQNIPHTPLRKIALLESPDYLWDDNLFQVISLLITSYSLPIEISMLESRSAAKKWFSCKDKLEAIR